MLYKRHTIKLNSNLKIYITLISDGKIVKDIYKIYNTKINNNFPLFEENWKYYISNIFLVYYFYTDLFNLYFFDEEKFDAVIYNAYKQMKFSIQNFLPSRKYSLFKNSYFIEEYKKIHFSKNNFLKRENFNDLERMSNYNNYLRKNNDLILFWKTLFSPKNTIINDILIEFNWVVIKIWLFELMDYDINKKNIEFYKKFSNIFFKKLNESYITYRDEFVRAFDNNLALLSKWINITKKDTFKNDPKFRNIFKLVEKNQNYIEELKKWRQNVEEIRKTLKKIK